MSTEQFTRALELTHSFNPACVSSRERLEAENYLMELRNHPEGLNLSFHIISNEPVNEVRCFWACNTIMHHLPALAAMGRSSVEDRASASGPVPAAVNDAQADELYRTLFSFIYRYLLTPQTTSSTAVSGTSSGGGADPAALLLPLSSSSSASLQQLPPQSQSQSQSQSQAAPSSALAQTAASGANTPSSSLPPTRDFLLNKHAQLMVVGVQCFYPARWQSFFDDLFDLLARGAAHAPAADAVAMYFLRSFEYIDERVVSVRDRTLQERSKEVRAHDMAVKDAMRREVIPRLVQTWFSMLSESRHRAPEIANVCLSVVQTYIEWIDPSLIMTPEWINLFYFTMTVPPTVLRVSACECILSMVVKKQLPGRKMESLRALNVVASLPRIVSMLTVPPSSDEEMLFADAVARLVVAVAEQFLLLMDICTSSDSRRPPSSVLVDPDTGFNMVDVPFEVSEELLGSLADALHAVMAQLLRLYRIPDALELREVVLPLLQSYLKSPVLSEEEAAEVLTTTFAHTRVSGLADAEDRFWDDATVDHRKVLYNVLRLLHRRYPALVLQHLIALVRGVVQEATPVAESGADGGAAGPLAQLDYTHPEVVEAVLRYAYEVGEALRLDSCLKDLDDPAAGMVVQLLTCEAVATHQQNACVHLAFFEMLERYYLFFVYHAEFVPVLLQRLLLLPCGVTNPNDRVRARVCYLFSHLLQLLRGSLRAYAADMVQALLEVVNAPALPTTRAGRPFLLLPSDRRELFEATGTLLSVLLSSLVGVSAGPGDAAECERVAERVVRDLLDRLHAASSRVGGAGSEGSAATTTHGPDVADALTYISAFAKGLGLLDASSGLAGAPSSSAAATRNPSFASSPAGCGGGGGGGATATGGGSSADGATLLSDTAAHLARLFCALTEQEVTPVLASPWASSAVVRDAGGQFMRQILNTVPFELIAGAYEQYVQLTLASMDAVPELSKLLRLMYQSVNKAGAKGVGVVTRVTPPAWAKVELVGPLCNDASPLVVMGVVSESAKERVDLYKQFFGYLFSVASWGCAAALLFLPEECCSAMLAQLRDAVSLPPDLELPRTALQTMTRLTTELFGLPGGSNNTNNNNGGTGGGGGAGGSVLTRIDALLAETRADANDLSRRLDALQRFIVEDALPAALRAVLRPAPPPPPPPASAAAAAAVTMDTAAAAAAEAAAAGAFFDLSDGKAFLVLGEVGHLCRACCSCAFADSALRIMFAALTADGRVSEEEAMAFCLAVRDQPRFNSALKLRFRQLLQRAQQQWSHATFTRRA